MNAMTSPPWTLTAPVSVATADALVRLANPTPGGNPMASALTSVCVPSPGHEEAS